MWSGSVVNKTVESQFRYPFCSYPQIHTRCRSKYKYVFLVLWFAHTLPGRYWFSWTIKIMCHRPLYRFHQERRASPTNTFRHRTVVTIALALFHLSVSLILFTRTAAPVTTERVYSLFLVRCDSKWAGVCLDLLSRLKVQVRWSVPTDHARNHQ